MKKYLQLLILCFSLTNANSQSLTVGEIYDYNIGDIFIREGGNWAPPHYEKAIITNKHFSSLLDTVFYTFDSYSYTAPGCSACVALYDTTYGIHQYYTNLNDTVGINLGTPPHYLTMGCIDTAGYTGIWLDMTYYDVCNILSTKINIMDNGPFLIDSCYQYFEPHIGYDEFGKGVGQKKHYYNTCSEGIFNCEEGSWLIYFKKGNDSCGNAPIIPPPVSVGELEYSNSFNIYPNPASNSFTIKNISSHEILLMQILNPLGESIYSEKLFGKNEYLFFMNLAKGIYFVYISDGKFHVVRKLVIE